MLTAIEQAIKAGEATHSGQIRFVVEGALDGAPLFRNQSARERALDIFSHLRIWDTAHNNGVLIYLLLADRDVEIVADRGIDAKVGTAGWEKICTEMETDFRAGNFERGVDQGHRGGVAGNGEAFSASRRRSERIARCAGGDLAFIRHSGARGARATMCNAHPRISEFRVRCCASPRNDCKKVYAFTDGRSATRAIHATMLLLAVSSGWPTWAPKSSQQ